MTDPAARQAFERADMLTAAVLARWPDAWTQMDHMRTNPPMPWPEWCLLPMGAAMAVAARDGVIPKPPPPVAAISALYAWRFCRSVYLVEPALTRRLLNQVPDALDLDLVAGLPEWCVYLIEPGTQIGLFMHLEYDANNARPELRVLVDLGGDLEELLPIPVYLDRPSVTEAIADYRDTTAAAFAGTVGANVTGAAPDAIAAGYAEQVDGYVGLAAYLARPEADIVGDRYGARPVRVRRLARGRTVWRVGYSG